jgi:hypothetical protein
LRFFDVTAVFSDFTTIFDVFFELILVLSQSRLNHLLFPVVDVQKAEMRG